MKRAALPLLSLSLALALGALPFRGVRKQSPVAPSGPVDSVTSVVPAAAVVLVDTIAPDSGSASLPDSTVTAGPIATVLALVESKRDPRAELRAAARRRLKKESAGTYIGDILDERDSAVARWDDRHGVPLAVWIQPQSSVPDFKPELGARVQEAFEEWSALNLPVKFSFVSDSSKADVHVTWIDHFSEPISGRTKWSRDDDWVITDANIVLAVHHSIGDVLDEGAMHAMALHEIGHLLGLDHTRDGTSIMAPMVRARSLTDADRATVRLVYALPAGPLR